MTDFFERLNALLQQHEALVSMQNLPELLGNGIYTRWQNPVLTAAHVPVSWRYDMDVERNPFLMERLGVNATFNPGAIYWDGQYLMVVRVEGYDRKSFFAIASSDDGVSGFRFWDKPIELPQTAAADTNVYDMRLTRHADGYIYGLFCSERKDRSKPNDATAAIASCGIVRTKDLVHWDRLPDLITHSGQQRNVVLHPEFVDGNYGLYTRPQDGFIDVGSGGGIGWGLVEDMTRAEIHHESIVDGKQYHTIKELKNGLGPSPIKTLHGWLHLAHGVRNTAAGLRYVLYLFMTALDKPWQVTHMPGGYFLAPEGEERVGDVSNVVFANGWIVNERDEVFIYYASSDTRIHVATTTISQLVDYAINTPCDGQSSASSVATRIALIEKNQGLLNRQK